MLEKIMSVEPGENINSIKEIDLGADDIFESSWALVEAIDRSIGASVLQYGLSSSGSLALLLHRRLGVAILISLHHIYSRLFQLSKLTHIKRILVNILTDFENRNDLTIYGCITVEKEEPLDLFVRFSGKANFFISVRSKGKSMLFYDVEKDWFYGKRKRKSRQKWKSHLINEMRVYVRWISKNRKLFNLSSRQVNKTPYARIVVICSPTEIANHDDKFYISIGDIRILLINKIFFVMEKDLIILMKAFLDNQIKNLICWS